MTIRRKKIEPVKKKYPFKRIFIIALAVILIGGLLYLIFPQAFRSAAFFGTRVKNTFSHYLLKQTPIFYYLNVEKNGQFLRVWTHEMLEVTYRDEFGIISVGSDDLTGKRISVRVEELGKGGNDIRLLLRGIDLVNKIMAGGSTPKNASEITDYKIRVYYLDKEIGVVPMKVVITPQDWLRSAQESGSVAEQIN